MIIIILQILQQKYWWYKYLNLWTVTVRNNAVDKNIIIFCGGLLWYPVVNSQFTNLKICELIFFCHCQPMSMCITNIIRICTVLHLHSMVA